MLEKVIRINQFNQVFLEETDGLTKKKKEIDLEQLGSVFIASLAPTDTREVDLPFGTIKYIVNEKCGIPISESIIIETQPISRPLRFFDTVFSSIPFPKLLFMFNVNSRRVNVAKVCAVTDTFIKDSSKAYSFPYSNVYETGVICFGSNGLPDIENLLELAKLPELFLSGKFNNDLYAGANTSGIDLRELLELLEGTIFDNSILMPMGTVEDFIKNNNNSEYYN